MMTLEHEMTYRLKTRGPLGTTDGSPTSAFGTCAQTIRR